YFIFFFQAEDGIRDKLVTGVQTCALPILALLQILHTGGEHLAEHRLVIFGQIKSLLKSLLIQIGLERFGQVLRTDRVAPQTQNEIGRASCRERGEISVVEGGGERKRRNEE